MNLPSELRNSSASADIPFLVPQQDEQLRSFQDERLEDAATKMEQMRLRHEEERRRLRSEADRLERRNRDLEIRWEAEATRRLSSARAEVDREDDESTGTGASDPLKTKLRRARAEVLALTSLIDEAQRRGDDARSTLERKLERSLRENFDREAAHAARVAALRREIEDLRGELEADRWADVAQRSFASIVEREHRKDELSLLRSRADREAREKADLIESLREALAARDRNVEALTRDLDDARAQIRRMGGLHRRGSALEGVCARRDAELFGQLHQALGVPEEAPAVHQTQQQAPPPPAKPSIGAGTVPVPGGPIKNVANARMA